MKKLTADAIKAMVANGEPEGKSLEFKEKLPEPKDNLHFLRDASALANAGGGVILYGIAEKRRQDGRSTGVAGSVAGLQEDPGPAILRLEQVLASGIEPRIRGHRFYIIDGFETGSVLALEIPRSWLGPHMVCVEGRQEFYSRHGKGNLRLDVEQIRAAVLGSEGVVDRITRFRDERLGRIIAGETPVSLTGGPRIVLHVMPLISFGSRQTLDMKAVMNRWRPLGGDLVYERRLNIDGLLCLGPPVRGGRTGYVQVFRSGAIETVDEAGHLEEAGGTGILHTTIIESSLAQRVGTQGCTLVELGIDPPFVVCGALLNAKGCKVPTMGLREADSQPRAIDRDVVVLPEVTIENPAQDVAAALTPLFEAIFEAGGWPRTVFPR